MAARFQKSEVEWSGLTSVCKTFFFGSCWKPEKERVGVVLLPYAGRFLLMGCCFQRFASLLGTSKKTKNTKILELQSIE